MSSASSTGVLIPFSEAMEGLVVGESCFAHVRGYPWWPAKVTDKDKSKRKCYNVTFFGTRETAWLTIQDVERDSSKSREKFDSPAARKRKHFGDGLREMMEEHSKKTEPQSQPRNVLQEISNTAQVAVGKSSCSEAVKLGSRCFNGRDEYLRQVSAALEESEDVGLEIIVELEDEDKDLDTSVSSNLSFFDCTAPAVSNPGVQCEECGKTFKCQIDLVVHLSIVHKVDLEEDEEEDNDEEEGIYFGNGAKSGGSVVSAKGQEKKLSNRPKVLSIKKPVKLSRGSIQKKQKKKTGNNVVRSLREEDLDNYQKFNDHVESKDGGFSCKVCKKFSSITKLLAMCHVTSCLKRSNKQKKGRPMKKCSCLECGQEFSSKKDLKSHHRKEHICDFYTCSTCLKQFDRMPSFVRHIRSHKNVSKLSCTVAGCEKAFRYGCDLRRHLSSHSNSKQLAKKVRICKASLIFTFQISKYYFF